MSKPYLTIGMATSHDHKGVMFTIQALRMYHPVCMTDQVEFIIMDNAPTLASGLANKDFAGWIKNVRWIPCPEIGGTTWPRHRIFEEARGEIVLVLDSHVLLQPGAIDWLIEYYTANPDSIDLIQGPNIYNDLNPEVVNTHMDPVWRGGMFGTWANDPRGRNPDSLPFEIPMHGLGLFAMRKSAWPGMSNRHRGFGGEEGNLHRKIRNNGGKTLCCPRLTWWHLYEDSTKFPRGYGGLTNYFKIRNYLLWWQELHGDQAELVLLCEHFAGALVAPQEVEQLKMEFGMIPELDWLLLNEVEGDKHGLEEFAESLVPDGHAGATEDGESSRELLSRSELPAQRTPDSEQPPAAAGVGWERIRSGHQRAGVFDSGSLPEPSALAG